MCTKKNISVLYVTGFCAKKIFLSYMSKVFVHKKYFVLTCQRVVDLPASEQHQGGDTLGWEKKKLDFEMFSNVFERSLVLIRIQLYLSFLFSYPRFSKAMLSPFSSSAWSSRESQLKVSQLSNISKFFLLQKVPTDNKWESAMNIKLVHPLWKIENHQHVILSKKRVPIYMLLRNIKFTLSKEIENHQTG